MIERYASLWKSAHRGRLLAGGVLVLAALAMAGALLLAASDRLGHATQEKAAEDATLEATSAATQDLATLRGDLARREARARALKADHFNGPADRVGWAEGVEAAVRALHPLTYTAEVGTVQHLPLPDAIQQWYGARGLEPPQFTAVGMELAVQGLHEDELVALLRAARRLGGGVTRVEHCKLVRRADDIGIDASCSLRRYGVGRGAAEVAVEGHSDVDARHGAPRS